MSDKFSLANRAILQAQNILEGQRKKARGKGMMHHDVFDRYGMRLATEALEDAGWTRKALRNDLTDGQGHLHVADPLLKRWIQTDEPKALGIPLTPTQRIEDLAELAEQYAGEVDDPVIEAIADTGAALMKAGVIEKLEDIVFTYEDGDGGRGQMDYTEAATALAEQDQESVTQIVAEPNKPNKPQHSDEQVA